MHQLQFNTLKFYSIPIACSICFRVFFEIFVQHFYVLLVRARIARIELDERRFGIFLDPRLVANAYKIDH